MTKIHVMCPKCRTVQSFKPSQLAALQSLDCRSCGAIAPGEIADSLKALAAKLVDVDEHITRHDALEERLKVSHWDVLLEYVPNPRVDKALQNQKAML